MPEIIERDGTQVEVFTAEEVAARETQAAESVRAELDSTKSELERVNGELKKLGDKDHNFAALRAQKEELEKKIAENNAGVVAQIDEVKRAPLVEFEREIESNLSGGDDELKKKIKFHYDRLSDKADTKEAITKKMNDAYLLAVGGNISSNALSRAIPGGGGRAPSFNAQALTPEQVELGKRFGLTEEDMKPKTN